MAFSLLLMQGHKPDRRFAFQGHNVEIFFFCLNGIERMEESSPFQPAAMCSERLFQRGFIDDRVMCVLYGCILQPHSLSHTLCLSLSLSLSLSLDSHGQLQQVTAGPAPADHPL